MVHELCQQGSGASLSNFMHSIMDWGMDLACNLMSNLNPNAKSFTPTHANSLNPNAKEFTPKANAGQVQEQLSVPDDPQEPVTPPNEPEVLMKNVIQRKCTPWIPPSKSLDLNAQEDIEFDIEVITDDIDEDSEDSEEEFEDESRPRLLSICSDDGFIQFEDESPKVKSPCQKIKNPSEFMKKFLLGNQDSDNEDTSEDEEDLDEGDWDASVDAIFLDEDDELLKLGLQGQWHKPILNNHGAKNDNLDETDHCSRNFKKCDDAYAPNADQFDLDYDAVCQKVRDANAKWSALESNLDSHPGSKVTFCHPLVTQEILEDPDMAEDLRAARIDSYAQKRADQDRYNRLLAPIFKHEHRDKIRSYIDQRYLTDR
jgi:hypothetical protein